jgi:hypothetical protein
MKTKRTKRDILNELAHVKEKLALTERIVEQHEKNEAELRAENATLTENLMFDRQRARDLTASRDRVKAALRAVVETL